MTQNITFNDVAFALKDGETILDGLLRHDQTIPNSCRNGACQSCMMQADTGEPGAAAQEGLKDTLKAQKYFLACQCVPEQPMQVSLPSLNATTIEAEISHRETLCHDIILLPLKPLGDFSGRAGQYVNILLEGGTVIRSYSIANLSETDGYIDVHIRRIKDGRMSNWAHNLAEVGDIIRIRGAAGDCFYMPADDAASFPIILAGTGTGLAPLEGILLDALHHGHTGDIHIIHGALKPEDLYHRDALKALAAQHVNVTYTACVLNTEAANSGFHSGALDAFVADTLKDFDKPSLRAYFCGAPEMVNSLKMKAFLGGVASKHIFSDPFLTARERLHVTPKIHASSEIH